MKTPPNNGSPTETESFGSSLAYRACYGPIMLALRGTLRTLAPRWAVTGRSNLPLRGAFILAPNHISDLDPPIVGIAARRPLWFMAKRELFAIPVLGPAIRFAQAFPVERGGADRAALRRAEKLLQAGQPVVVFPEGQLSKNGELQKLLPGVSLLALRANVPIVPVGIAGTNMLMPYGRIVPSPTLHSVRVHFGEPLDFSDMNDLPSRAQREQSTERLEQALRAAVKVARAE